MLERSERVQIPEVWLWTNGGFRGHGFWIKEICGRGAALSPSPLPRPSFSFSPPPSPRPTPWVPFIPSSPFYVPRRAPLASPSLYPVTLLLPRRAKAFEFSFQLSYSIGLKSVLFPGEHLKSVVFAGHPPTPGGASALTSKKSKSEKSSKTQNWTPKFSACGGPKTSVFECFSAF